MKQRIKRFLCCCLAACLLFTMTAYARPDWPADTGIQAEAGIVIDADSGAVLFAQNSHVAYPPASITKLLTALIVLEHCQLDETVTYSYEAMHNVEADSGNKLSLQVDDQMTVEDSLYALLLVSVNQSANALAEHTAGSISAFVDMMNEKAAELGCTESHFDNPSGLNGDTQYVTAYDMSLIAQAAFNNEALLKISSARTHKIGATTNNPDGVSIQNEHRLVITDDTTSPFYYPPAIAGKTGYLVAAGNTLVTYAEQDGRRLISVILKGSPRQYFVDAKTLLEFGFARFQNAEIAQYESRYVTGDGPIELDGVIFKSSDLMVEPGRMITLPNSAVFDDAEISLGPLPETHPANAVALLTYTYNDRKIGEAFLLAKNMPAEQPDDKTAAPTGEEDPTAAAPEQEHSTSQATPEGSDPSAGGRLSFGSAVMIGLVLLLVAAVAGAIGWITYSRKKEAAALAARRERRRRRLQEDGEEDEFNRLLEELKNKNNSAK